MKQEGIAPELKQELLLQINQRLLDGGYILNEIYREAKIRIVNDRT